MKETSDLIAKENDLIIEIKEVFKNCLEISKQLNEMDEKLKYNVDLSNKLSDKSSKFYYASKNIGNSLRKSNFKSYFHNFKYCLICIIIMIILYYLISFFN